ncbi:MAG TPA: site-specific integrase [Candidatus Micrarchaeaceae archaeon]|nr:site-specific integrase [Candidatus Micrarchaeaceae archaeon]
MSAGRRGNGEGTIFQRKDGRWTAGAEVGGYQRKWIYGKTRREVADRLTKIQRDVAEGRPVINERLSVAEYLNRWLNEVAKHRTRPMTWLHILPSLGRVRLAKLTPQHVQSLVTQKVREGRLSPRTIQYMHSVLRAALNQAVRWRMVHYNAAAMVSTPRVTQREVLALTPEEARRLLDAARGDRLEALYSVALALGLRQGEALGLMLSDLDLEVGTLRVRRASQRIPHQGTQLVETKTERSRRTLVMPRIVISALRSHRARQALERLAAGEKWVDLDLVFPSERGTLADGPNVTHRFHKLLKRADLPPMRFHDLRHACASLLLVQSVDPRVVMETLGHSQISLTMNTYSHVLPALQWEAADKMESVLTVR